MREQLLAGAARVRSPRSPTRSPVNKPIVVGTDGSDTAGRAEHVEAPDDIAWEINPRAWRTRSMRPPRCSPSAAPRTAVQRCANRTGDTAMTDVPALRTALLTLHSELLAAQRIEAERFGGRMSSADVLQAAADDLRFDWLRILSQLIAELDEASQDAEDPDRVDAVIARARALFAPPDATTAFGARYLRALGDNPGVVLAHRDVVAAL